MALELNRLTVFLALFAVMYFLEAMGGSYMVSAIQSIERQFQIPSKISGFLVSASDIGYIPTVIFISYIGGKGNRAKWIGAGCVLMALAHILTASPNFLFPVKGPVLNLTEVEVGALEITWGWTVLISIWMFEFILLKIPNILTISYLIPI